MKHFKILPPPITRDTAVDALIERNFLAYNAARLREACLLLERRILKERVTVGLSLTGALTPAGLGASALVPLIKAGFVDYIVSTGANLYHDLHFATGENLFGSTPFLDDRILKRKKLIRIYDILMDQDVLFRSDKFVYRAIARPEFQKKMGTAEFHHRLGRLAAEAEVKHGRPGVSVLAAAYEAGVPVFTSSPGDSTLGMNVAAASLAGSRLELDVSADVNESTAIVFQAQKAGESGVLILGGGSPKNFLLQTEPQITEILGIDGRGHDYYIQFTDARPDTGGLSGATPSEAVSWGKVDPDKLLPNTVVCYTDSTIALPLLTAYVLNRCAPRQPKRYFDRLGPLVEELRCAYLEKVAPRLPPFSQDGGPTPRPKRKKARL